MSYSFEQAFANRTRDTDVYRREMSMYGCTIAEFKESVEDSLTFKLSSPAMVAMSLMSDAQVEMAHGMPENARLSLNRAKWVLSEYIVKT